MRNDFDKDVFKQRAIDSEQVVPGYVCSCGNRRTKQFRVSGNLVRGRRWCNRCEFIVRKK